MNKAYICYGFKNLKEFLDHHRLLAKGGSDVSKDIIVTAERIALAKLDEEARARAE